MKSKIKASSNIFQFKKKFILKLIYQECVEVPNLFIRLKNMKSASPDSLFLRDHAKSRAWTIRVLLYTERCKINSYGRVANCF